MTKQEEILQHIRLNPFISQQELADKVGLSRPAVANYIRALTNNGKIIGRAYVIRDKQAIVCIGGMNIDRKARADHEIITGSSNPVQVREMAGGVARNVAENMNRLDYDVTLISAVGDDKEGVWLLEESKEVDMDVSKIWILHSERTGTYTTLLDPTGETFVAMADMNVYDNITIPMIKERWASIETGKAVFLDMNFPENVIHYIIKRSKEEKRRLFVTSNSSVKIKKLPPSLQGIESVVLHKREVEHLLHMEVTDQVSYEKALSILWEKGVTYPIILSNHYSLFYVDNGNIKSIAIDSYILKDDTGIQEGFMAGFMHALLQGKSLDQACYLGLHVVKLTAETEYSVSPDITDHLLKEV